MITVYSTVLFIVTTLAVGKTMGKGDNATFFGWILCLPVFFRAMGWI